MGVHDGSKVETNMFRHTSKVALITGAGHGIGAAIAERLADDGFTVVVNYASSAAPAEALVKRIEAAGGRALATQAEVSDTLQVRRMFDAIDTAFGRVDVVVNVIEAITALRRSGRSRDIASTVAFLAGPDGGRVNGQTLHVNGAITTAGQLSSGQSGAGEHAGANADRHAIRHPSARVLFGFSNALARIAAMLRRGAKRANAAIEQRRQVRLALEQLDGMGERELRDIGLTRADIPAAVYGRLTRDPFARFGGGDLP